MLCPLLAGLWTSLGLEKNIVYYRSHSKHLFYKPAHALFLAFDPHTDTLLSEHPFPSYLFFPLTMNTDDSIRSPHGCGSRSAVLQFFVREVTHKANPLHMLEAYSVLAFYELLRNKTGIVIHS